MQLSLCPGTAHIFHDYRASHSGFTRSKKDRNLPRDTGLGQLLGMEEYRRIKKDGQSVPSLKDSR